MHYERKSSANDKIRLAVVGYGVRGHFDLDTALKVPAVELAGICDLYIHRIRNAKEKFGNQISTARNYEGVGGARG